MKAFDLCFLCLVPEIQSQHIITFLNSFHHWWCDSKSFSAFYDIFKNFLIILTATFPRLSNYCKKMIPFRPDCHLKFLKLQLKKTTTITKKLFYMTQAASWDSAAALNPVLTPSSPPPPPSPMLCFWSHRDLEPLHSSHSSRSEQSALGYLLAKPAAPGCSVCLDASTRVHLHGGKLEGEVREKERNAAVITPTLLFFNEDMISVSFTFCILQFISCSSLSSVSSFLQVWLARVAPY